MSSCLQAFAPVSSAWSTPHPGVHRGLPYVFAASSPWPESRLHAPSLLFFPSFSFCLAFITAGQYITYLLTLFIVHCCTSSISSSPQPTAHMQCFLFLFFFPLSFSSEIIFPHSHNFIESHIIKAESFKCQRSVAIDRKLASVSKTVIVVVGSPDQSIRITASPGIPQQCKFLVPTPHGLNRKYWGRVQPCLDKPVR